PFRKMGALETPVAEGIDHQFSTNAAMIARSGGSPVLLQRRADFSVHVHVRSFLDHRWGCVTRGGLCPASRLLPTFFNAVCSQVARRAGKKPGEVAAPAILPRCHGWACGSSAT